MKKIYVLDTNVMIQSPLALLSFEDNDIVLPIVCLEELDRLKSDMEEQKALRINEEAALVRLKLQISNLKKENAKAEEKAPQAEPRKKPEEMIDEFPDDIFTGSVEEVDLSDDED